MGKRILFSTFALTIIIVVLVAILNSKAIDEGLIDSFRQCTECNQLEGCIARHGTFNVEAGTFGGKLCWKTYEANGWKLQINALSGWWRILNKDNVRMARGTTAQQLRQLLNDKPSSLMMNYWDKGFCFSKTAAKNSNGKTVFLLHGWGVRASSMQGLADELANNGYDAFNYDYPSSKLDIEAHSKAFLQCYRDALKSLPPESKVYFLTHSMGALVLRGAMSNMSLEECRQISGIIMLGPPNKGSKLAYFAELPFVSSVNASLKDMIPNESSFVSNLKDPPYMPPVGIIAGDRDEKVSLESTKLPERFEFKHITVKSTHPGLRNPKNVMPHILSFLESGKFNSP